MTARDYYSGRRGWVAPKPPPAEPDPTIPSAPEPGPGADGEPSAGGPPSARDWCPECDVPALIEDDSLENVSVPLDPSAPLVRVIRFDCGHTWESVSR